MSVDENDERASAKSSAEDATGQPRPPYTKEEGTRLGTKEDSREADQPEGKDTPERRDNLRDGT